MGMRRATEDLDDELDLPPADGLGEEAEDAEIGYDELDAPEDDGDALDDATGEDAPLDDVVSQITGDPIEVSWLEGSEDAAGLDVGSLDIVISAEEKLLEPEEPEVRLPDEDFSDGEQALHGDSGEEGPLAEDEELREEDLPALDADEAGDVDDAELYDRAILDEHEQDELRWDDRAWARDDAALATTPASEDMDDSGTLAVWGDDPRESVRDAVWKRLDETGRLSAAAYLPGGSVVVAVASPDHARALLVRIQTDGTARIIAEIDPSAKDAEDDGESCRVTMLRWNAPRGVLIAMGTFGTQAFRPAL